MKQHVAEETADQTSESQISYSRLRKNVETVEAAAAAKGKNVERHITARIEDKGFKWIFRKLTGRATERVERFNRIADLERSYEHVKDANVSVKAANANNECGEDIGQVDLTGEKTRMRRVINMQDDEQQRESFLSAVMDNIREAIKTAFRRKPGKSDYDSNLDDDNEMNRGNLASDFPHYASGDYKDFRPEKTYAANTNGGPLSSFNRNALTGEQFDSGERGEADNRRKEAVRSTAPAWRGVALPLPALRAA